MAYLLYESREKSSGMPPGQSRRHAVTSLRRHAPSAWKCPAPGCPRSPDPTIPTATTLTKEVKAKIAKDAELLSTGEVKAVKWIFFESPITGKAGASGPLLDALKQAGIQTEIVRNVYE